jgi:class 3 adenylate cyclase/pimeloyl-ACP methyl ester carboxylesterase
MAEPRIQYVKTSDGVKIAFWTMGEGTPLVYIAPLMLSHTRMELQGPSSRSFYERLSEYRKLIRYDCRAAGLSDRSVKDYSLPGLVLDLEAVVDRLDLESFNLFAQARSGMVAVMYAVHHPERVSHLILWNPTPSNLAMEPLSPMTARQQALRNLREQDWELYAQLAALLRHGWSQGEEGRWTAELMREASSPEALRGFDSALADEDVTALLPQVKAPTLVIHRREAYSGSLDAARATAADIPDAQMVQVEGQSWSPWSEDEEAVLRAIDEFLGDGEKAAEALPSGLVTVLFTDLVGHTEMMSRLGDAKGRDVLREHERITREVLKANGGTEVKTMGDGFMASFGSVTKAVECAIALQRAFAEHGPVGAPLGDGDGAGGAAPNDAAVQKAIDERNRGVGQGAASSAPTEPLSVRVGLNAGEPIEEDGDLFGATVILASRIAAKADGGEILVADTVRGLCSGKGFLFADRGEFVAKGFEEPVRVYEVSWRE